MATVYTRRLFALYITQNAVWTVAYVRPPGGTVIVRDLILTNPATSGTKYLSVQFAPVTRTGAVVAWLEAAAGPGSHHVELRQELAEGEQILLYGDPAPYYAMCTAYVFQS